MKVKICGLRRTCDIDYVNTYRPDYIGFIFYPKSFRYIDFKKARDLKSRLNPDIGAVGVFVDESVEKILEGYREDAFDLVQLHGSEDERVIEKLKERKIPVIKAIKIKNSESFKKTEGLTPDYFLFDVDSKTFVGGTGESFNWDLLKNYDGDTPYFLAGGVNTGNVKNLPEDIYAVDVSSGVETRKYKDKEKIKSIIEKLRG